MLHSSRPSRATSFPYIVTAKTTSELVETPASREGHSHSSSPPDEYQTIRNRIGHQLLHDDHRRQQQRPIPSHSSKSTTLPPGVATLLQSGLKSHEFSGRKRAFCEQTHGGEQQPQRLWIPSDPWVAPRSCFARPNGAALARVHPHQSRNVRLLPGTSHASPLSECLSASSCSRVEEGSPGILKRKQDASRHPETLVPQFPSQTAHGKMQQRCFPSMDKSLTARTWETHEAAVGLRTDTTMPASSIPLLQRKASASNDSNCEHGTTIDGPRYASVKPSSAPPSQRKNSRYLREIDRRVILPRIARGEKQSALAKEFQVSRAAICNLNKHCEDVWLRRDENPLAKHPKKSRAKSAMMAATTTMSKPVTARPTLSSSAPSSLPMCSKHRVYEIMSRSVAILLTMVRARNATLSECRRYADHLLRLVIEDALSLASIARQQADVSGGEHKRAPCGIALRPSGAPMLGMFHLMDPAQPTGYIRRHCGDSGSQSLSLAFHSQDVPSASPSLTPLLRQHNVFLFDVAVQSSDSDALADASRSW